MDHRGRKRRGDPGIGDHIEIVGTVRIDPGRTGAAGGTVVAGFGRGFGAGIEDPFAAHEVLELITVVDNQHGTGHFVDDLNGWFSTTNAFFIPLAQDAAKLKASKAEIEAALAERQNVMLDDLFYIASGGAVGERTRPDLQRTLKDGGQAKESFADLWSLYVSDETGYNMAKNYFPRTVAAFESLLDALLKEHR